MADTQQFPTPATPYSLEQIVKKILAEPQYGKFIHAEVLKMRKGNKRSEELVSAHFRPTPKELSDLNLERTSSVGFDCSNPTTTLTIDFTPYV